MGFDLIVGKMLLDTSAEICTYSSDRGDDLFRAVASVRGRALPYWFFVQASTAAALSLRYLLNRC
jgi:hypothetical protein